MVDPEEGTIAVLVLEPGSSVYVIRGVFSRGEQASSSLWLVSRWMLKRA
jgi:hypothetical protein